MHLLAPSAFLLAGLSIVLAQLSRADWTATADSEQSSWGDVAKNAIDGSTTTVWQTHLNPSSKPPHWIQIDMGKVCNVSKLTYLPRDNGSPVGNIGNYTIHLGMANLTGTTLGTPVASGKWADDQTLKKAIFSTREARYVLLTALSEAGTGSGRGNYTIVADINLFDTLDADEQAAVDPMHEYKKGKSGPTIDRPLVPAAAATLPSGNVLLWAATYSDYFNGQGNTQTVTYYSNGAISPLTQSNTQHDMFCPGISFDENGRLVVTGGNNAQKTSIFDLSTGPNGAWQSAADMKLPRGYQSQTTLSDGRIFTIGGSWTHFAEDTPKAGEIYDPVAKTWTLLANCPVEPMLTNDSNIHQFGRYYRQDNHGWIFAWKDGSVFQAGPSKNMNWYVTSGTGSTMPAGTRLFDEDSMNGNAIMYDALKGKILTVGGAVDYEGKTATAKAHIITIKDANQKPSVIEVSSMEFSRAFHNSVVLPDGTVFVTGGMPVPTTFSDFDARYIPELYNPATQNFTSMNRMAVSRTYHSVAILLPDATVMNGGGGLCYNNPKTCNNHFDAEIFSPPYLFKSDNTPATRPKILSLSQTSAIPGNKITVITDTVVTRFSLVRLGSATHSVCTPRCFQFDACLKIQI